MQEMEFKRGDAFSVGGTIAADITGWEITSQIRKKDDTLVAELVVTISQATPTGVYTVEYLAEAGGYGDTNAWPTGDLYWDIQFVDSGGKAMSTETIKLPLERDVTRTVTP